MGVSTLGRNSIPHKLQCTIEITLFRIQNQIKRKFHQKLQKCKHYRQKQHPPKSICTIKLILVRIQNQIRRKFHQKTSEVQALQAKAVSSEKCNVHIIKINIRKFYRELNNYTSVRTLGRSSIPRKMQCTIMMISLWGHLILMSASW